MNCENCGKNPASVHYTAYQNNEPKEMHICHECAVDKGIIVDPKDTEKFSIQDPIISLFGDTSGAEARIGRIQCPTCGLLFSGFRETGRLGCAGCYEAFKVQLRPLIRRIHGNLSHTGKSPAKEGDFVDLRSRLERLQQDLDQAVARENFERAAELRDEMKNLREGATKGGGEG